MLNLSTGFFGLKPVTHMLCTPYCDQPIKFRRTSILEHRGKFQSKTPIFLNKQWKFMFSRTRMNHVVGMLLICITLQRLFVLRPHFWIYRANWMDPPPPYTKILATYFHRKRDRNSYCMLMVKQCFTFFAGYAWSFPLSTNLIKAG